MVENAKKNGGFIDQTEFKTADKYVFDAVIMNKKIFKVLDMYICQIPPKMHPTAVRRLTEACLVKKKWMTTLLPPI